MKPNKTHLAGCVASGRAGVPDWLKNAKPENIIRVKSNKHALDILRKMIVKK